MGNKTIILMTTPHNKHFGNNFAVDAAQDKKTIYLWPMLKKISYLKSIALLLTMVWLVLPAISQNKIDTTASQIILEVNDTTYTLNDSLSIAIIDSTSIINDSTLTDSTATDSIAIESKWDFTSKGGNDST
jgi:hypothetical protein